MISQVISAMLYSDKSLRNTARKVITPSPDHGGSTPCSSEGVLDISDQEQQLSPKQKNFQIECLMNSSCQEQDRVSSMTPEIEEMSGVTSQEMSGVTSQELSGVTSQELLSMTALEVLQRSRTNSHGLLSRTSLLETTGLATNGVSGISKFTTEGLLEETKTSSKEMPEEAKMLAQGIQGGFGMVTEEMLESSKMKEQGVQENSGITKPLLEPISPMSTGTSCLDDKISAFMNQKPQQMTSPHHKQLFHSPGDMTMSEILNAKTLVTSYREAANFLYRAASELEQLLPTDHKVF